MIEQGGSDTAPLLEASGLAAKETGEAIGAALMAATDIADEAARGRAIMEVEEGIEALQTLRTTLFHGGRK
jgi:hypothetical protein